MKKRSVAANKKVKDTVFRALFKDKENLLSLYNALNGSEYTDVDGLEVRTLENAVYMNFRNDLAYVFHEELNLYEHQSTKNPNLPLRLLFYVADVLHAMIDTDMLYSSRLYTIPTPRFVVLYNGKDSVPEEVTYRLSDAYKKPTDTPELELIVKVYNINPGHNEAIVSACKTLSEYVQFVAEIRRLRAETETLDEAVNQAVDYCIEHDILRDFLKRHRAEAVKMSIYEYDEEKVYAMWAEEFFEEGRADAYISLVADGVLSEEDAANRLDMTVDEFHKKLQESLQTVQ